MRAKRRTAPSARKARLRGALRHLASNIGRGSFSRRPQVTPEFAITLRTISEHLFWGFVEKQTRYSKYRIAEPEKALLDWIYLTLQSGLTPRLDEIELHALDKQKLVKYADKYPKTVRNALTSSLAFEHFAA